MRDGMSARISSASAAGAGEAMEAAAAAINIRRGMALSSIGRDEFNHIGARFESGAWNHHPPARRPDSLDEGGDVAVGVMAIVHGAHLVAEHQSAEKDLAQPIIGKNCPHRPL